MREIQTRLRVNVRRQPEKSGTWVRTLSIGTRLSSLEVLEGEEVSGERRWHRLADDEFVWHGGCEFLATSDEEVAVDPNRERPSRRELGDFVPPFLHTARGVRHKVRGRRPRGLEGLIVHFDAYRIRKAGNGDEDSDRRTLDMMRSGESNGFHYLEISRTGKIYAPEGFDWLDWGYHAGPSTCPVTGRTGVSQYYVGVEMNNPGVLHPAQEADVFCPWFNSRRHPPGHRREGQVILDANGRCTRVSASDEWYSREQVRHASGGNIHDHWYLPYSFDQFESLTNLVVYLARTFSGTFKVDLVLGHDEVAPDRKDDPGGALANPDQLMRMSEFRDYLRSIA